jgi:hypothetical protein
MVLQQRLLLSASARQRCRLLLLHCLLVMGHSARLRCALQQATRDKRQQFKLVSFPTLTITKLRLSLAQQENERRSNGYIIGW